MSDNRAGTSGYSIEAKPQEYRGHMYESSLECKTAKLLDEYGIVYAPHQSFEIFWRNGENHTYTVDFLFYRPQKFVGIPYRIHFLEVKGVVREHDINRKDALEYCYDCKGYVAEPQLIKMWKRDELVTSHEKVWHKSSYSVNWYNKD
jgi:hypothetical protein